MALSHWPLGRRYPGTLKALTAASVAGLAVASMAFLFVVWRGFSYDYWFYVIPIGMAGSLLLRAVDSWKRRVDRVVEETAGARIGCRL